MPSDTPIKALTISQPYASLIACGQKFVENRTWETLYRGPLLIHAGKGMQYLTRTELSRYPNGCVIAIANLTACLHIESIRSGRGFLSNTSHLRLEQIRDHRHAEGPFCWILENIRSIESVRCSGAQGLWTPPQELVDAINQQLNPVPTGGPHV